MPSQTASAGDRDLTVGQFAKYLEKVQVPVAYGGFVFTYIGAVQFEGLDEETGQITGWKAI